MNELKLTKAESDALDSLAWGMKHFGGLVTNRACPRRAVLSLVNKGLAKSLGQCVVCDDDGFQKDPERWREGFALTDQGQRVYEERREVPSE